jgi:hypothetical protein
VPDSEAASCMACLTVVFGLLTRPHHCRRCGMVVCNGCSKGRLVLDRYASPPLFHRAVVRGSFSCHLHCAFFDCQPPSPRN